MYNSNLQKFKVLNLPVYLVSSVQTMEIINQWVKGSGPPKHLVTAYSEFFVHAQKDKEFGKILNQADLVVPDGIGPLAAIEYLRKLSKPHPNLCLNCLTELDRHTTHFQEMLGWVQSGFKRLLSGFETGASIILGQVGIPVTGVWLTDQILSQAMKGKWKVFLLGGYGDTASKLKIKYQKLNIKNTNFKLKKFSSKFDKENTSQIMSHPGIVFQTLDQASNQDHKTVIKNINKFKPDILLVAYGPVKQEKWIAKYKSQLKTKVIIGVGGSFDELTGKMPSAPRFMQSHGLKWLWRLIVEPRRFKRIWKATIVFPCLVWRTD